MTLLTGLRVVQLGDGLAAAVCGRLLADLGAQVDCVGSAGNSLLAAHLDHGKTELAAGMVPQALAAADLVVCEGSPRQLAVRGWNVGNLRRGAAALVTIAPFGQAGPRADETASDLTLFCASAIARMLTGQVDDLTEPPIRPVGRQSAFLGGIAAACAGMHAVLVGGGPVVDVSIQEALATLAMTELARAGQGGPSWGRRRVGDGNGATVCILPARDGYAAISPREERQWTAWLAAMGSPAWGGEPRFARKADRVANWDALHALMSAWSRQHDKQAIADLAQAAHVPSFPLREPAEQLASPQLRHRGFLQPRTLAGHTLEVPGSPFGLAIASGVPRPAPARTLPLAGVRVLDFSWVIAGPTTTRILAAMGAEVIKVEAPGAGDPGRASELHTVLGQAKRAIVLDLKTAAGRDLARRLADASDVLVENFATGVMDRLGLGAETLRTRNPKLIYVSASGLGRTGPEAQAVAYGTLLQCYAGFAGLNRHPGAAPRVGMAWLDPMCGLMLAFVTAAALWQRRTTGGVARVDFSMVEAMLWTMAEPLLAAQAGAPPQSAGNRDADCAPHGLYRCAGEDAWVGIAVAGNAAWQALCGVVPGLSDHERRGAGTDAALEAWTRPQPAEDVAARLQQAGVAAAALATSRDLVDSAHLRTRGFWDQHGTGVLPGLPWRASFGRATGPAPALGADTDAVLAEVLGLSPDAITGLRRDGVLG